MNPQESALQTIIKYVISSGLLFVVLKYLSGIFQCINNFDNRKKKLQAIKQNIIGMVRQDYASRGLALSGMVESEANKYKQKCDNKINQLRQYRWFGDNASSDRIIDDFEKERENLKSFIETTHFHWQLKESIEKISHTLSNAEVLESTLQKNNRPKRQ